MIKTVCCCLAEKLNSYYDYPKTNIDGYEIEFITKEEAFLRQQRMKKATCLQSHNCEADRMNTEMFAETAPSTLNRKRSTAQEHSYNGQKLDLIGERFSMELNSEISDYTDQEEQAIYSIDQIHPFQYSQSHESLKYRYYSSEELKRNLALVEKSTSTLPLSDSRSCSSYSSRSTVECCNEILSNSGSDCEIRSGQIGYQENDIDHLRIKTSPNDALSPQTSQWPSRETTESITTNLKSSPLNFFDPNMLIDPEVNHIYSFSSEQDKIHAFESECCTNFTKLSSLKMKRISPPTSIGISESLSATHHLKALDETIKCAEEVIEINFNAGRISFSDFKIEGNSMTRFKLKNTVNERNKVDLTYRLTRNGHVTDNTDTFSSYQHYSCLGIHDEEVPNYA